MKMSRIPGVVLALGAFATPAVAIKVSIDTRAAHATLDALQNPDLSHAEAERIARMPENDGPIRKLHEFKIDATVQDLADALYATAHDEPVSKPEEKAFLLDWVKPKVESLRMMLSKMENHPEDFQAAIEARIAAYTTAGEDVALNGYVVAVGDGGGYAFGNTDFYLNLVWTDDFAQARNTATHELYHAVQGAFARDRDPARQSDDTSTACRAVQQLFANVYEEGSAVEVSDISLYARYSTPNALRQKNDIEAGMKNLGASASLLEMSVASLTGAMPVPYDKVYAVGFYGHGVLYAIAFGMAHAIVESDGPVGLGLFARRPPSAFIRRYTQLPSYGKDSQHPALGRNTLAALDLVGSGCP